MLLKNININKRINKYGTSISTKDFLFQVFGIIGGIIVVAYFLKLIPFLLIIIVIISIMIIPLIILSWYRYYGNATRFSLLTDYLSNAIPIFMQKPKIRYTLGELSSITSGSMKRVVDEAIDYLDKTKDDSNMSENALKIIENEFPNTRIKSIHKFIITVENNNSSSFRDVANNLYEDIEGWIKRTYLFQKDIKNRRDKLLILCILTLLMDLMFIYVYGTNDFFLGYTDNMFYQISTVCFIVSIEIICAIILSKLNGEWLINDTTKENEEKIINAYKKMSKGKEKPKIIDIIISIISFVFGLYIFYIGKRTIAYALFIISILVFFKNSFSYANAKKIVNKNFKIEFPVWLREVSLNLGNLTVLNSIDLSINMASYSLRQELRKFLKECKKDPTAIRPYNDFLIDYDLEDARSSMRVLYAINNVSKDEMKIRISNLILRNQEMLAKSEKIRNEDSIGGIESLGYLPTIIFVIQMAISMFIMFGYMLNSLSGGFSI